MKRIILLFNLILCLNLCLGQRVLPLANSVKADTGSTPQNHSAFPLPKPLIQDVFSAAKSGKHTLDEMDPPSNLSASLSGNDVFLTWDHPEQSAETIFQDGFESYPDFALTFDPWVLLDLDQGLPYGYVDVDWPNSSLPQSYIIFNPAATLPPIPDFSVHGGSKLAASISSPSWDNNDWMISPLLSIGSGAELSFWAKSYTASYGLERFRVKISGGSTSTADFVNLSGVNYIQAPAAWTLFSYDLSAYAGQNIRFAIQCVSSDAFIFLVDDVRLSHYAASSPLNRALLGYRVYRNGVLVESINDPFCCAYDDLDMESGPYTYTVTAYYSAGESTPAGPVSININDLFPPQNLSATTEANNVTLIWDRPIPSSDGEWISWGDDEITGNSIGTGSPAQFDVAHMFDAADLAAYQGLALTMLKFVPGYQDCVYTIKVWTGGSATEPASLVYSAVLSQFNIEDWNLHVLSTPIPIPADRLWIGYGIDTQGGYPAKCDSGPVVEGKGNIMNFGGWTTLTQLAPILPYNWMIQGFVAEERAQKDVATQSFTAEPRHSGQYKLPLNHDQTNRDSRTLTAYRVSRNGVQVGYITDPATTSFFDPNLNNGTYSYAVTAVYSDGESPPATIEVLIDVQFEPLLFGDGFESYQDFSTVLAPWTTLDRDLSDTNGFAGYSFPGSGNPMAYMVFNPSASIPPMNDVSAFNGNKMLASFAATMGPNSDWLITPRLSLATGSTLRFYAKSHTADFGLERIKVGVSTMTTIIPQGFQYISGQDYVEVPTNWTEYVYDLSFYDNQDVYLAIRCVSFDAVALYLDDVAVYSSNGGVDPDPFGQPVYLPFSMDVEAGITIEGVAGEVGDVVAAFVNVNGIPQLRGKASLQSQYGINRCQLQVNTSTMHETVNFKVWQSTTAEIFTAPITLNSIVNGYVGTWPNDLYMIDAISELNQSLPLARGWNLISLNLMPVDASLQTILSPIANYILEVKSPDGIFTPGNPYTQLQNVETGKAYSIKTSFAVEWNVSGFAEAESTPIALIEGWNLRGYLPQNPMPVADALQSIIPALLELKGKDGVYIPGNPYSTLDVMHPGKGYWMRMAEAQQLIYPASNPSTLVADAEENLLPVQPYPQSMVLLARCDWAEMGDILIARVGKELRGAQRLIAPEGFPAALLQIFVQETGEEISLWILKADGTELPILNNLEGMPNITLGTYPDFVSLFKQTSGTAAELVSGLKGCYPNPFNPSTTISFSIAKDDTPVVVSIFNLRGQMVAQLGGESYQRGNHQLVFNAIDRKGQALSSGIYIIELKAGSYRQTAKALLAK